MTAREYLENKYTQMRGDKWNTHDVINDNWVAEMMTEYAEAKAKEAYTEGVKDWEAANEKANKILDGLREKSKYVEAYNQGVRDAAESKSGINIKYKDHVSVVLTANDRDTYTSKSEEFMDFLHSVDKDLISKQSILKLLK